MVFDEASGNFVSTGRASNGSNPCRTNFYPGCLPSPWVSVETDADPTGEHGTCDFEDCYYANRAISRVHTAGRDLATMGAGGGNEVVELGGGPNDQLYVQATFTHLNTLMGVVMVYDAATYRQEVRRPTPAPPRRSTQTLAQLRRPPVARCTAGSCGAPTRARRGGASSPPST